MTLLTEFIVPECAPIRVDADGPECCLCVHGFTSCPAVYTELAERLAGMGYALSAPLLPGHGTTPEDLGAVAELEWFEAVAREYEALRGRYRTIHVVGLSLGGAIASWLAASRAGEPGLGRLVLLSPAYGLANKDYYAVDYASAEDRLIPIRVRPRLGDGLDAGRYQYSAMPLRAVGQLMLAAERGRASLPGITAPTALLYTAADAVVDPARIDEAATSIRSIERVQRYDGGEHNLLLGPDRLDVVERVAAFLER